MLEINVMQPNMTSIFLFSSQGTQLKQMNNAEKCESEKTNKLCWVFFFFCPRGLFHFQIFNVSKQSCKSRLYFKEELNEKNNNKINQGFCIYHE